MWPEPSSKSAELYERATHVEPGGINRLQAWQEPFPIYAASGAGQWVTDVDGVRRLDFANNFASLIHGHAHPAIVEAVNNQITLGTCFIMPTEAEIKLAELLCKRVASFELVRFCNTGTEAVMIALKAARAYTGRPRIAKFEGAYHGMYDYAEVSLDASPENWGNDPRSIPFTHGTPQGVLQDVVVIPFNDIDASVRILREHRNKLAAVLIDPVPLACGMIPIDVAYLSALLDVAREIGALIIFDEVVTFRLGPEGAQGLYDCKPDMTTLAKLIGGGFPVAAIAGSAEVMSVFDHRKGKPLNPSSGTYTANPVGMTAGRVAMELMTDEAFQHLNALGERAREGLNNAIARSGYRAQVTGIGSMFRIHLNDRPLTGYRDSYPAPEEAEVATWLQTELLKRGIISTTKGFFLSTPMSEKDIDDLSAAADECLTRLAKAT